MRERHLAVGPQAICLDKFREVSGMLGLMLRCRSSNLEFVMDASAPSPLATVKTSIIECLHALPQPGRRRRGRPEILPMSLVWMGMLVCILHRETSQRTIWRLLTATDVLAGPPIVVSVDAISKQLRRTGAATMEHLFRLLATEVLVRATPTRALPFPQVVALDESTLDPVAFRLPWARAVPRGSVALLPGKLIATYDVPRYCFRDIQLTDQPQQNERVSVWDMVSRVPVGSPILADLDYFGFRWFGDLTDAGYRYISRWRQGTSYGVEHVLMRHALVIESLGLAGGVPGRSGRASGAPHRGPARRADTVIPHQCDRSPAAVLASGARTVSALELAFKLAKTDLGLHLIWSTAWNVMLAQLWDVLIIAQIALATQRELAERLP